MLKTVRIALYAVLIFVLFLVLHLVIAYKGERQTAHAGVFDLSSFGFSGSMAMLPAEAFDTFPGEFLQPEGVTREEIPHIAADAPAAHYGTYRFSLWLPPGQSLLLSFTNLDFAYSLYANEVLLARIGAVGDTQEQTQSIASLYAISLPPGVEKLDILIHYANFIRPSRMGPLYLGTAQNTLRITQAFSFLTCLVAGCTLAASIMFMGVFLSYQRRIQYLAFSLCCFFLTLHTLIAYDAVLGTLLGGLSGVLVARIEYASFVLAVFAFFMYLNAMFEYPHKRVVLWTQALGNGAALLAFAFSHPAYFTGFRTPYMLLTLCCGAYVLFALIKQWKQLPAVGKYLLLGLLVVGVLFILEAFFIYRKSSIPESALSQTGMILFVCINMIAMSMQIQNLERTVHDATERERFLQEVNEQLQHINMLKTEFLSSMSHEMKTPLTVISGYAQLSAKRIRQGIADEETIHRMNLITKESSRLAQLATRLLQLRFDASDQDLACDVCATIRHTAALFGPIALRKDNEVRSMLPDGDAMFARIGEDSFVQVILNLLANANQHTRGGHIDLYAQRKAGWVQISVDDSGSGIREDVLLTLFDRHITTGDGTESAGLGLHICKEIIETHGGEIAARNRPEGGAQITFTLPEISEKDNE